MDSYALYWKEKVLEEKEPSKSVKTCLSLVPQNAKSVLDVGAGNGNLLLELRKKGFAILEGIDYSSDSVNLCRANGLRVHQENFNEKLMFEDNSFDCVVSCNSLFHSTDPDFSISEFKRISNNYVLIYVTNHLHFRSRITFLLGNLPYYLAGKTSHKTIFSLASLKELFKKNGLNILSVTCDGHFNYVSQSLFATGFCILGTKRSC